MKSPPDANAGLPAYFRRMSHSVSEEEEGGGGGGGNGSRRSSISEDTPSNGHGLPLATEGTYCTCI